MISSYCTSSFLFSLLSLSASVSGGSGYSESEESPSTTSLNTFEACDYAEFTADLRVAVVSRSTANMFTYS